MKFLYSSKFLRSFQKLPKNIQDEFRHREILFRGNLFNPKLRTHKLKGKKEWAFLVTYKIRVTFVLDKKFVLLVNIGDHSVYRK